MSDFSKIKIDTIKTLQNLVIKLREENERLKENPNLSIRPTIQKDWVRGGHLIEKLNEEVLEFTKARTVDNTIEEFWDVVQCLVNYIDYIGISEEMIMEGLKVHNEKLLKRGWEFKNE